MRAQTGDRFLLVEGKRLFFNSEVADNYSRLVGGRFNEPETHVFIRRALGLLAGAKAILVEVGANVGEFVIDFGDCPALESMWAFEPQPEQYRGLTETARINQFSRVRLINKAVSNSVSTASFRFQGKNASSSGLVDGNESGSQTFQVQTTTLDSEIPDSVLPFIFLLDAEGAELRVLKGAERIVRTRAPLIIFEYNHVTRMHFSLQEVRAFLGPTYHLFRLTPQGTLDSGLTNSWNLVAVPQYSVFSTLAND